MPEFIVRTRKISHILFIVSLVVSFVSFYFNIPIIFILSVVYSAVFYLTVPRHQTKTGKATFEKTCTVDVVISRPITLTARSEKALKAKITNYEKTHTISSKSSIKIIKKEDHTEYSIILQDISKEDPSDSK